MSGRAGGRFLADVNVWLATLVREHPHHDAAVRWWRDTVLAGGGEVCFCRFTQLGLLRLLCNRRVMGKATRTSEEAWSDYVTLLQQDPVTYLEEPPGLEVRLAALVAGNSGTAIWSDAYLAAFALAADVTLATFDRGFCSFAGLRPALLDPVVPPRAHG